jgi:hypothetical protein
MNRPIVSTPGYCDDVEGGGLMMPGETEVLGENLPQCRFIHQKPDILFPDTNPGCHGGTPATNPLRCGTALFC